MKIKKKKKKVKKYIVLVIIILAIVAVLYFVLSKRPLKEIFSYKNELTIEVGEKFPVVNDYLYKDTDENITIKWDNLDDKVPKMGTYNGTFTYKEKEYKVTLKVIDSTKPIISGVKNVEILAYSSEPDFLKDIVVTDNSMEDIKAVIKGEYNLESVGEYTLYYEAKDSSGNTKEEPFKLIVKENKNVKISKTSKGFTIKNSYGVTSINNQIIANKSYSLPSNYVPSNLVLVNSYIRVVEEVKDAFNNLKSDSASIGLNIYASSGYRSYGDQNYIYNNYVKRDGKESADTYSARAGYSEHQTGLAIDVNTVDMSFDNTNESNWLREHAPEYGFVIRYPKGKDNITGYMYEPWHIRYVGAELAKKLYNNGDYITLEEYFGIDSKY